MGLILNVSSRAFLFFHFSLFFGIPGLYFEFQMNTDNDKIPIFKTWKQWYWFVILFLILLIILFDFFTKYFS